MIEKILEEIKQIASLNSNIKKVSMFGSRARGDNNDRSDIDIAIYFNSTQDYNVLDKIEEIETLLKIDVTIITETLSSHFLNNIKNEEIVIYEQV